MAGADALGTEGSSIKLIGMEGSPRGGPLDCSHGCTPREIILYLLSTFAALKRCGGDLMTSPPLSDGSHIVGGIFIRW